MAYRPPIVVTTDYVHHLAMESSHGFIPSGVPRGGHPGELLTRDLIARGDAPACVRPVLEEGTYAEIKQCVFDVCSVMAGNVMLESIVDYFCTLKVPAGVSYERPVWSYACGSTSPKTVTVVQVCVTGTLETSLEAHLAWLGREYGFGVTDFFQKTDVGFGSSIHRHGRLGISSRTTTDFKIFWPYWT